jgi:hypothetical protein
MRLGGGGALIGSPPADVNYVYSRELGTTAVEQGAIGPHPVEDFSP